MAQNITNVVASNRMEALYHKSIPKLGAIEKGQRLVGKTTRQVPAYPRWWLVEMDWVKIKIAWRNLGAMRVKRWVKTCG